MEGVIGPLTSAAIKVNFASLKLTWLLSCGVQSALDIKRHARYIADLKKKEKKKDKQEFPDLTLNVGKIAILQQLYSQNRCPRIDGISC